MQAEQEGLLGLTLRQQQAPITIQFSSGQTPLLDCMVEAAGSDGMVVNRGGARLLVPYSAIAYVELDRTAAAHQPMRGPARRPTSY